MRKIILFISCVLFSFNSFSQTIKELEQELRVTYSKETKVETNNRHLYAARELLEMNPYNIIATGTLLDYYNREKIDSSKLHFEETIRKYPFSVQSYIYASEFVESLFATNSNVDFELEKIKLLQKGLTFDSLNKKANYLIAELYYNEFIYSMRKKDGWSSPKYEKSDFIDSVEILKERAIPLATISNIKNGADSALTYFIKLWRIDENSRAFCYFPIKTN